MLHARLFLLLKINGAAFARNAQAEVLYCTWETTYLPP